jgi:hypothetical protein
MSQAKTEPVRADPFFIGWLPMPVAHRRFLLPFVAGLVVAAAATAAAVAFFQRDPGGGRWEEDSRTFDGVVYARPCAMLRVPGSQPGEPPRTMLLVEEGKFGALPRVAALLEGRAEGLPVRVTGTVLQRDGRWVLEVAAGDAGMRRLTAEEEGRLRSRGWPGIPEAQVLGERVTLRGEVIDPKCYLGAMRPGGGKTHKACAMLCVAGGVPPMLVTRDADRRETFYLLTTTDGGTANEAVGDFVGDAVEVNGRLERHDDLLVLKLASDGVRRR